MKAFKRFLTVLIVLAAGFFLLRGPVMDKVAKVRQDIEQENRQREEDRVEAETPTTPVPALPETPEPEPERIFLTLELPEGRTLPVEVMEEEGRRFFPAPPQGEDIEADVSPSREALVVLDSLTQDLFLLDVEGNVTDITYQVYSPRRSNFTESKESVLGRLPDFVWAKNPKFLSENQVVYLSMLPWFGSHDGGSLYFLYVVELEPLSHDHIAHLVHGVDITLLSLEEEGLRIEADGVEYILTEDLAILR